MKALGAGVFPGCLAELVVQRLVDLGETGVIFAAQLKTEIIRDDSSTLDIDAAIVVHLAQKSPAELDRTNAGVRTT